MKPQPPCSCRQSAATLFSSSVVQYFAIDASSFPHLPTWVVSIMSCLLQNWFCYAFSSSFYSVWPDLAENCIGNLMEFHALVGEGSCHSNARLHFSQLVLKQRKLPQQRTTLENQNCSQLILISREGIDEWWNYANDDIDENDVDDADVDDNDVDANDDLHGLQVGHSSAKGFPLLHLQPISTLCQPSKITTLFKLKSHHSLNLASTLIQHQCPRFRSEHHHHHCHRYHHHRNEPQKSPSQWSLIVITSIIVMIVTSLPYPVPSGLKDGLTCCYRVNTNHQSLLAATWSSWWLPKITRQRRMEIRVAKSGLIGYPWRDKKYLRQLFHQLIKAGILTTEQSRSWHSHLRKHHPSWKILILTRNADSRLQRRALPCPATWGQVSAASCRGNNNQSVQPQ